MTDFISRSDLHHIADSTYAADFVDGDCCCDDWKARLKK